MTILGVIRGVALSEHDPLLTALALRALTVFLGERLEVQKENRVSPLVRESPSLGVHVRLIAVVVRSLGILERSDLRMAKTYDGHLAFFTEPIQTAKQRSPVGQRNLESGHVACKAIFAPLATEVAVTDKLVAQPLGTIERVDHQGLVVVLALGQFTDHSEQVGIAHALGKVRNLREPAAVNQRFNAGFALGLNEDRLREVCPKARLAAPLGTVQDVSTRQTAPF